MELQPLHIPPHHLPRPPLRDLPHHLPVPHLPLPRQHIQHPLRRSDGDLRLLREDGHGAAQVSPLGMLGLGGEEFFFEAVDVVDDGDVAAGVCFEGGDGGEVGGGEVQGHGEAHQGCEEAVEGVSLNYPSRGGFPFDQHGGGMDEIVQEESRQRRDRGKESE